MLKTSLIVVTLIVVCITPTFAKDPPVITESIHPRKTGKLGESIRLNCPIRGDPILMFEWYRDGERVMEYWNRYKLSNGEYGALSIQNLECEDQGTYICKAVNGFGVQEISFQLHILSETAREPCKADSDEEDVSSKPIILPNPTKKTKILKPAGNYALIKCLAIAEPLPKFRWFKDGVEIVTDKGHQSGSAGLKYVVRSTVLSAEELVEVSETEGLRSTLQISDLRGTDTANYTCRAENEHGWDELTHILEVVERQVPQRPELHPDVPPVHTWVETGHAVSLSCKVKSEFTPDVHWLKRLTPTPGSSLMAQPTAPDEAEVESINPQFIANRTIVIGSITYQILPSAPIKKDNDGYYSSILLLSKKSQDADGGYYVCLALNNAGYNFRQVYLNVTNNYPASYSDEHYPESKSEGWGDKGRADVATMVVVIVVVICGLAGMVVICLVWKQRKNSLKDKTLSVIPASSSSAPEAVVVQQQPPLAPPTPRTNPPSLPDYSVFRNGLSNGGTPPTSIRSDPVHKPLMSLPPYSHPLPDHIQQSRVHYLATRPPPMSSPRQQKLIQQRTKLSSASGRSGSGSRQYHHRSSPRSSNHHHYYNQPHQLRKTGPPETRSLTLTTDTSFHSDSFYPDWSAHPHHIRLPYPSPESSFDQL